MPEFTPLPFDEAIDYHRQKVRIPTRKWDDLKAGMHSRGFVIAGAMKDSLIADFQSAVDKAISRGTTLAEFRKDFDNIVKRHGWSYKGSRGWRSRVIYQTNVSTAYQAGRYKQMLSPNVVKTRPYHMYVHGGSKDPRPDHLSWDGLILPYDDPFWAQHRPKNGWGCKCSVRTLSEGDLKRMGKSGPDSAPAVEINPATGIPKGLDKGWNYDPAFTAWGHSLSMETMNAWRASGHKAWDSMLNTTWQDEGLAKNLAFAKTTAKRVKESTSTNELKDRLKGVLNGDEKVFSMPTGGRVLVNAESLAQHMALNRSQFVNFIPEMLESPDEIWLTFQRHKGTGKVFLRQRIVKALEIEKGKYLIMVAQSKGGILEAWTFIPSSKLSYLNQQRKGKLLYSAERNKE